MSQDIQTRTALITGASDGLGRALAHELARRGWHVVITARGGARLGLVRDEIGTEHATAVVGDITDPDHRTTLARAIGERGLDLVVNNASTLGPSPMPALASYPLDELAEVFDTNVIAPLGVLQLALPHLTRSGGIVVNISSDAAIGAYAGWGGYGASKAALDQLTAVFAAEHPDLSVYAFDPGDMRTEMHQAAFPGEDISDRPEPESVIPSLLTLIDRRPPSGRYIGAELPTEVTA